MNNLNRLQPLADALVAARCPDGTWPEPLDWLAGQVLRKGNTSFGESDWVPFDAEALHWPEGWAYGLGRFWLEWMLPVYVNTDWAGRLGMMLDDPLDIEWNLAALVEAVKASIASSARRD